MATCKECGKKIRQPKDMSVGAASRIHYWKYHREVMMAGVRKAQKTLKAKARAKTKAKR